MLNKLFEKAMLNHKIFGVVGIKAKKSSWNNDFEKTARNSPGGIYASNGALKYSIRDYWKKRGYKVFIMKSFDANGKPLMLKEKYEKMFPEKISEKDKKNPIPTMMVNALSCTDVENFGVVCPIEGKSFGVTGAVQITEGDNKYEHTIILDNQILSPFAVPDKDKTKEDKEDKTKVDKKTTSKKVAEVVAVDSDESEDEDLEEDVVDLSQLKDDEVNKKSASTLGNRKVTNLAHYYYGLSIDPNNYINEKDMLKDRGFGGYSLKAFEELKEGLMYGATGLNSVAKVGCENEFMLLVHLKEGSLVYMANLHDYVDFNKEKEENNKFSFATISLNRLFAYIEDFGDEVDLVEVYYNKLTTILEYPKTLNTKIYSILSGKEIK